MYFKDAGRTRDCKCAPHKGPCGCSSKKRPQPSRKPKTLDVDPAPGVMSGVASETQAINTARATKSSQNIMTPVGAQPAFTMAAKSEPADEEADCEKPEVAAEKSGGDRIREAYAAKDVHARNFLKAFYRGRAAERAKRAS
jgi:hypothetical protein